MSMQLSQQAAEIVGKSALVLITERVDDVARLIGQMVKMGWPEVLDRPLPRHWKQRGLRWGWTAVMWLAHMLTEGDHRKVSVEASIKGMQHTLSRLTAQAIEPLDCRDDRLGHLLQHVSKPTIGTRSNATCMNAALQWTHCPRMCSAVMPPLSRVITT